MFGTKNHFTKCTADWHPIYHTSLCVSSIKNEITEEVCAGCEVLLSLDMSLNCTYLIGDIVRIYIIYKAKSFQQFDLWC